MMAASETSHNDRVEKGVNCIWRVVSFFAASASEQERAVGKASYNFFISNPEICDCHNKYLVGLYMIIVNLYGSFDASGDYSLDETSTAFQLKSLLDLMYWATERGLRNYWTIEALHRDPIWMIVRVVASKLLDETKRASTFSCDPIDIEYFVEPPTDPALLDLL